MSSGLLDEDAEIPARTASMLDGVDGGQRCQTGGCVHSPLTAPWRGDEREVAKTRLFKYVRRESDGLPLAKVVRDVFGADAVEAAGADYQLARRFFGGCEWFKIARRGGNLWVEPRTAALNLSTQYANGKTSVGRGDGLSGVSEFDPTAQRSDSTGDCHGLDETGDSPQYPKDRAQSVLDKRTMLDGRNGRQDYRAELLRELDTEREIQQDKFARFDSFRGRGTHEHILIRYATRFNDADRAGEIQQGFRTALRRAADRHRDAVVVTLTTDAKRHSSVSAALSNLYEAKGRFMSWIGTDYQLGKRPDNLTVLEFTESGLPHVHLVLFGIDWLLPQSQIAAKWDSLGQGSVVDIRSARCSRDRQRWYLHNDDGGRVTMRQYLGKAIRGLQDVAQMDAGSLVDAAESGDVHLWRQALYWATERQYYSCSPSLKESTDEGLPHVKRYEFVGVAQYREIPGHVRRNAVILDGDRPPPRSGRTAGTAAD